MNTAALFDVPAQPQHPAKYTDVLLPVMAAMLKGRRRILDPFGGTGKVFLWSTGWARASIFRLWNLSRNGQPCTRAPR